jgi:glycine/D-amino acid oxidase-like deaminating enzyme
MFTLTGSKMRIYHPAAFEFDHAVGSYWEASADPLGFETARVEGGVEADIAIIGGGYAGLHAATRLAGEFGMDVAVLEAGAIGWGASGRNGGFCCPGAVKLSWQQLVKRFGVDVARRAHGEQRRAVEFVGGFLEGHGIDADRTGEGELLLAHRPSRVEELKSEQAFMRDTFGEESTFLSRSELAERGNDSPMFHAGLQSRCAFGLHPLKYVRGLARVAHEAGARLFANTEVTAWNQRGGQHVLTTAHGEVTARRVLVATNGYTDESLPEWMGGRLLPALTRIIVTRPMSDNELKAQGWTRHDPSFDTRHLLHYFRLLPGNRMMFGGRGGTDASPAGLDEVLQRLRGAFDQTFPAWQHVETEYSWGGLVCITPSMMPYAGPVPGMDGVWAAYGWHGNGVSMASFAANRLAGVIAGAETHDAALSPVMRQLPGRFVLPQLRMAYLKAAYVGYAAADRWL